MKTVVEAVTLAEAVDVEVDVEVVSDKASRSTHGGACCIHKCTVQLFNRPAERARQDIALHRFLAGLLEVHSLLQCCK